MSVVLALERAVAIDARNDCDDEIGRLNLVHRGA
jgi:hypothetical protein